MTVPDPGPQPVMVAQPAGPAGPPPSRPLTLTLVVWGAILIGLLGVVSAVTVFMIDKQDVRDYVLAEVKEEVGAEAEAAGIEVTPEMVDEVVGPELDSAMTLLKVKGASVLVMGLLIGLFGLLTRGGATWARVLLTILLVINFCSTAAVMGENEVLSGLTVLISGLVPLLSLVLIVMMFLPPTNRYARARKATP